MSTSDRSQWRSPDDPTHILLVEDNPGDARLIHEAFDKTDGETNLHVVTDGADAITFLDRAATDESGSVPDLVLLDLNLPAKDGYEVLDEVRDDPRLQRLPIIVLTSSAASDDVRRCYEAAANAYLTKPATLDEFTSMAKSVERFWFSAAKLPPL